MANDQKLNIVPMTEQNKKAEELTVKKNIAAGQMQEARKDLIKLLSSSKEGDVQKLSAFLKEFVVKHPDDSVKDLISETKDGNGRTCLHFAAFGGSVDTVKYILGMWPEGVDVSDEKGDTPLLLTAMSGGKEKSIEVVTLLLDSGANVNRCSKSGAQALHHAAGHGDIDLMNLLVSRGANLEYLSGVGTPLHWAAGEGQVEACQILIADNSNVDHKNEQGLTPILMAAARGAGACVALLAKAGADCGQILGGKLTILHICADLGSAEAVRALLDTDAGKSTALIVNEQGLKAIHMGAMSGCREVVELLYPYSKCTGEIDDLILEGSKRAEEYYKNQEIANEKAKKNSENHSNTEPQLPPPPPIGDICEQDKITAKEKKDAANRLFITKDYNGALPLYNEAVLLDPSDATFWSNRSACYMELGQPDKACTDAEMARRLRPDWGKACFRLATARLALNKYEDAALAAYEGMKLEPDNKLLKKLMQKAVDLGREEYQASLKK